MGDDLLELRLVLAEFDIDKGNVVRLQYPTPVAECCDSIMTTEYLAEQMLPDGSHNLEEDWTVFILNRPKAMDLVPQSVSTEASPVEVTPRSNTLEAHTFMLSSETAEPDMASSWTPLGTSKGICHLAFSPWERGRLASLDCPNSGESAVSAQSSRDPNSLGQVDLVLKGGSRLTIPLHQDMVFRLVFPNPFADFIPSTTAPNELSSPSISSTPSSPTCPGHMTTSNEVSSSLPGALAIVEDANDGYQSDSSSAPFSSGSLTMPGRVDVSPASTSTLYSSDDDDDDDILSDDAKSSNVKGIARKSECDYSRTSMFAVLDGTPIGKLGILFGSAEDCKVFVGWLTAPSTEKFLASPGVPQSPFTGFAEALAPYAYRCLNCVRTKMDSAVRRGAVCKALACIAPSHCQLTTAWKPLISHALQECFGVPMEQQTEVIAALHKVLCTQNHMWHQPTVVQNTVWRFSVAAAHFQHREVPCNFMDEIFTLQYPMALASEEVGLPGVSLLSLVLLFQEAVMQIFNAMLLEKRVLFLGRLRPVGQIVCRVLSAVLLLCPPLRGLLDQRVFPYASLTNMTWMQTPAFIAGTVNPLVESKPQWWDVLCDLDNGKVVIQSPMVAAALNHPQWQPYDMNFIQGLMQTICKMQATGVQDGAIENFVHDSFRQFTAGLLCMADPTDLLSHSIPPLWHGMNAVRTRAMQATRTFKAWLRYKDTVEYKDQTQFDSFASQLRSKRVSHDKLMANLQSVLQDTLPEHGLLQLLAAFPISKDGLLPLAALVFHPSEAIRMHGVELLKRLEASAEGKQAIKELNKFAAMAYERVSRKAADHT